MSICEEKIQDVSGRGGGRSVAAIEELVGWARANGRGQRKTKRVFFPEDSVDLFLRTNLERGREPIIKQDFLGPTHVRFFFVGDEVRRKHWARSDALHDTLLNQTGNEI
jgi:hypothetical protein